MKQPDSWIILKIETTPDNYIYKVLAGWSGGYLDGNSWMINSGIVEIEEEDNYYLVKGESGSIYKCRKNRETVRMNTAGILKQFKDEFPNKVTEVPISSILKLF